MVWKKSVCAGTTLSSPAKSQGEKLKIKEKQKITFKFVIVLLFYIRLMCVCASARAHRTPNTRVQCTTFLVIISIYMCVVWMLRIFVSFFTFFFFMLHLFRLFFFVGRCSGCRCWAAKGANPKQRSERETEKAQHIKHILCVQHQFFFVGFLLFVAFILLTLFLADHRKISWSNIRHVIDTDSFLFPAY